MIATRSHSRSASSSRWVVRNTVTPRSRNPAIRPCTSCAATGSSPDVGSSRNITAGSFSSDRASAARCRRPLDRLPARSCARSARPTAASASVIRSGRRGRPYRRAKYSRFSVTVSRWYSPGDSGMTAIRCRISAALAGPTGMPATTADPDVGEISVPRIRTVVVLPAPFGPRNPNTSPPATRERHVGHRGAPAENLGQVADLDGRGHGPGSLPGAGRSRLVQAFIPHRVTTHFRPPPVPARHPRVPAVRTIAPHVLPVLSPIEIMSECPLLTHRRHACGRRR